MELLIQIMLGVRQESSEIRSALGAQAQASWFSYWCYPQHPDFNAVMLHSCTVQVPGSDTGAGRVAL